MDVAGRKVVGVLGGMGPEATCEFLSAVLRESGAKTDQDHIRLITDINPWIPDRNEAIAAGSDAPGVALAAMAVGLAKAGADFLVMPCNTAHAFSASIVAATPLPFVSIIDETVAALRLAHPRARRVGVLATSGCMQAGLYQRALAEANMQALTLEGDALARFMKLLYRIKAGERDETVRSGMRELVGWLARQRAEVVLAGCTEVPLVLSAGDSALPLIDSTRVLAQRTLAYARGEELLQPPGD